MFDLGFHQQIDLATDRLSNGRIGQLWGLLTIRPDNIGAVLEPDSGCTFTILRGGALKERGSQLECVQNFYKTAKHSFKLQKHSLRWVQILNWLVGVFKY